jgi:hypothetical protein
MTKIGTKLIGRLRKARAVVLKRFADSVSTEPKREVITIPSQYDRVEYVDLVVNDGLFLQRCFVVETQIAANVERIGGGRFTVVFSYDHGELRKR